MFYEFGPDISSASFEVTTFLCILRREPAEFGERRNSLCRVISKSLRTRVEYAASEKATHADVSAHAHANKHGKRRPAAEILQTGTRVSVTALQCLYRPTSSMRVTRFSNVYLLTLAWTGARAVALFLFKQYRERLVKPIAQRAVHGCLFMAARMLGSWQLGSFRHSLLLHISLVSPAASFSKRRGAVLLAVASLPAWTSLRRRQVYV